MNGTLQTIDGRPALRFERSLVHPVDRVWRAITVPAELGRWFPAAAGWTPEAGEVFEVGGQAGQVTGLQPPRLIEWTSGGQLFRFELRAEVLRAAICAHDVDRRYGRIRGRATGTQSCRRAGMSPMPPARRWRPGGSPVLLGDAVATALAPP